MGRDRPSNGDPGSVWKRKPAYNFCHWLKMFVSFRETRLTLQRLEAGKTLTHQDRKDMLGSTNYPQRAHEIH